MNRNYTIEELSQQPEVHTTSNYDKLNTMPANRPIIHRHVMKLKRSILANGSKRIIHVGKFKKFFFKSLSMPDRY